MAAVEAQRHVDPAVSEDEHSPGPATPVTPFTPQGAERYSQAKVTSTPGVMRCVDGCHAAAYVAYHVSDTAILFPITPSSPMGELVDAWKTEGQNNAFDTTLEVRQMQSEAGAAGAVHGCLAAGSLCTTFTASQGLLLMIPNMYKIAGELLPCVFHVAARAIAGQALSIFGDHQDVMAARQAGFAILSSHSVQQAMDMALVAHIATLKAEVPFIHFMDGFRTSHEISKIKLIDRDVMTKLLPQWAIRRFRDRALSPLHPHQQGTSQGPDIYFQMLEAANSYYKRVPEIVEETLREVGDATGRYYGLFDYHGDPNAEDIVVTLGSSVYVANETVDFLLHQGRKVGALGVHLFRPWSPKHFLEKIPKSVKRVAVLDRTKEPGSLGEPLYLDVAATFQEAKWNVDVIGGRYGLGSKDLTPRMVAAVFKNLRDPTPTRRFTVGIIDDVTNSSLSLGREISTVSADIKECMFWGLGSDGTVGANKNAVKIIGEHSHLNAQAYFAYDAHKSGGVTISHLRFGESPITAQYEITGADYVGCHNPTYIHKYPMVDCLKEEGVFVLNTHVPLDEIEKELPDHLKRTLARKNAKMYIVDASKIAGQVGLKGRINMVMQTAFFKLSGVLPFEEALDLLKDAIRKTYGSKGEKVVQMNVTAVDTVATSPEALQQVPVNPEWRNLKGVRKPRAPTKAASESEFYQKVMGPMLGMDGNSIPVSNFPPGGVIPAGTTRFEKRGVAAKVPTWKPDKCTQCNYCSFLCPHAVIRPFVMTDEEAEKAPNSNYITRKAKGAELNGLRYRIQISPLDCTGCEVCVVNCPDDALAMEDINTQLATEVDNFEYSINLPNHGEVMDRFSVKGSQFRQPLMEFSGACEGCGETPYVKLLTQLFGERLVIANATGCSSIWGGSHPANPYTVNKKGQGPAWANSLFEDNAEFGFGIMAARNKRREGMVKLVKQALDDESVGNTAVRAMLKEWFEKKDDGDETMRLIDGLVPLLAANQDEHPLLKSIYEDRDMLPRVTQWLVGGDGWAYDIGFGGLDHILASNENFNVLVLDTEIYSNTGGQASKATNMGATAKFALGGKTTKKKDIGMMAMAYEHVYVASASLSNMAHLTKVLKEADDHMGPSLVMVYSPCIEQGVRAGMRGMVQECEAAVDSGYWPLYRFNPDLVEHGKNPFTLDNRKIKKPLADFLRMDGRFINLVKQRPQLASELHSLLNKSIMERMERHKLLASGVLQGQAKSEVDANSVLVLYASETGTAEKVANDVVGDLHLRGFKGECHACDDIELDDLKKYPLTLFLVATCGQGAFPSNTQAFWDALCQAEKGALEGAKYSMLSFGDSSYYFFCEAAKKIDAKLKELGATAVMERAVSNVQAPGGVEGAVETWESDLWLTLKAKEPEHTLPGCKVQAIFSTDAVCPEWTQPRAVPLECVDFKHLSPEDYGNKYGRNFVHIAFKCPLPYKPGDSLALFPVNSDEVVTAFLTQQNLIEKESAVLEVKALDKRELPQKITVRQLFTSCLDIGGKPGKRFFEMLAHFCENAAEKQDLLDTAAKKGSYKTITSESLTYADVLVKYPSAQVPLPYLIDMIPNITPRLYSGASSPSLHPGEVHLCICLNEWETVSGRIRQGLTAAHISRGLQGTTQWGYIKASAMEHPEDDKTPLVMTGIGSGLAPFMSIIQDRWAKRQQGKEVGPMVCYFGNRHEKYEFLYREQLQEYVDAGALVLRTVWSDDDVEPARWLPYVPTKRTYVQWAMREDTEMLYDLLVTKKGYMYVCGNRGIPKPVQDSLAYCFEKASGKSAEEAEQMVVNMYLENRYNVESW